MKVQKTNPPFENKSTQSHRAGMEAITFFYFYRRTLRHVSNLGVVVHQPPSRLLSRACPCSRVGPPICDQARRGRRYDTKRTAAVSRRFTRVAPVLCSYCAPTTVLSHNLLLLCAADHAFIVLGSSPRAPDVTKVNAAVEEDPTLEGLSVEELMMTTDGAVFNSAAQVRAPRKLCAAVFVLQSSREELKSHCRDTRKSS